MSAPMWHSEKTTAAEVILNAAVIAVKVVEPEPAIEANIPLTLAVCKAPRNRKRLLARENAILSDVSGRL
jgi:hypothetical protein